jgi:pimeloyl-ACP methyl ester carboxylesterase/DNA-binding CsgD family transcriptional regulator
MPVSNSLAPLPTLRRFTSARAGLAYEIVGTGDPALLVIPGLVSHIEYDLSRPEICSFYQRLAGRRQLIRYDKRGCGLSDRTAEASALGLEAQVEDAAAVLDAAGVRRVAVLAWSAGGPVAIALAARYPRRVSRLILYGTYARFLAAGDYPCGQPPEVVQSLRLLILADWSLGSRLLANVIVSETDPSFATWFAGYVRSATSAEIAAELVSAVAGSDLRALLPAIDVPVLVIHRRHDCKVDHRLGSYLAEHLPRARLELLEGVDHLPYRGDSQAVTDAIDRFLCHAEPEHPPSQAGLSPRECDVLRLVAEGLHNREIAARLGLSPATVSRHLVNIYAKLGIATRAGAASFAIRRGLV